MNKMKIGKALRKERLKLGLTQKEICQGIISRPFYAKVENDEYKINAVSLFTILYKNKIDINEFSQLIQDDYDTEENKLNQKFQQEMDQAVSTKNVGALEKNCHQILSLSDNNILKLRAIVTLAYFKGKLDSIDESIKKEIKKEFDEGKYWTDRPESLRLFANTMPLWSQEELDFLIGRLLASIKNKKIYELTLERYLRIFGNYLVICYERNVFQSKEYQTHIEDVIKFIGSNTSSFHLMIYRLHTLYMKALFENDTQRTNEIRNELKELGYSQIVANWPEPSL